MFHYDYLSNEKLDQIFYIKPEHINKSIEKKILAYSLGATLYMPSTRNKIAEEIINNKNLGIKSIAIDLEDAIGDEEVEKAEKSLFKTFESLNSSFYQNLININSIPFIFIRVRSHDQMTRISNTISNCLYLLTGFIFPKFSIKNGGTYLEELHNINRKYNLNLYAMPILETSDIMYLEKRENTLSGIKEITDNFYDLILNIRIGATDFANIFGIRRGYDMNIHNISVLSNCIGSIVNMFGRVEKPYVISGPVWEYFSGGERIIKPQLRETPFSLTYGKEGHEIRKNMIDKYIDGLIYEVILDKANGLWGKTIIHPSHIIPVQSIYAVTYEEYLDAMDIVNNCDGKIGVLKSENNNKMNEIKTHMNWANKIILKSKIYGVLNEGKHFTDLF